MIDSLSSIGDFVLAIEHVDIDLDGLLDEFESLVTLISCRLEPLTIDEVKTLLAHEIRIEKSHKKSIASINLTETSKPNFIPNSPQQMCSTTTAEPQANAAQTQHSAALNTDSTYNNYSGGNHFLNNGRGGGRNSWWLRWWSRLW